MDFYTIRKLNTSYKFNHLCILFVKKITVWVQHPWDVKVFLSDIERGVKIFQRIILRKFTVVNQVGSMTMDKGAECQTILE